MLQEAKDLQNRAVSELLTIFPNQYNITFKAPTGSGKTFMMASFMDKVLQKDNKAVFILSSLSKGSLGEQNFKSIENFSRTHFKNLKPYFITSETSGENNIDIPLGYNVYVLSRDKYSKNSKLYRGTFKAFLQALQKEEYKIYLIKDECHIATNNLDDLIKDYFLKVINFSATPDLKKGQRADVEIMESEAVSTHLIKAATYDETATLEEALDKFLEIKEKYLKLGIQPALIIQISNKSKADDELKEIKSYLTQGKYSSLKYMYIVDNERKYDTNDILKTKKLQPRKWKEFAKENHSLIDIIIFKMVISEGWDIPRACMLYQIRDSQSKQLDEQVAGRVRRNPCLLKFKDLDEEQKELVSKAYIYGIRPKDDTSIEVFLKGYHKEDKKLFNKIQEEFILNTTCINTQKAKKNTNSNFVEDILKNAKDKITKTDIFSLYQELNNQDENLQKECIEYTNKEGLAGWFSFTENLKPIKKEYGKIVADYDNSMEVIKSNTCILPAVSFYNQTEHKKNVPFWVWEKGKEVKNTEFSFDSIAEKEFFEILYDEVREDCIKLINCDDKKVYLLGKNYIYQSGLKFEYFSEGSIHSSYPDFILKDHKDRFYIFEVKSVNSSKEFAINTAEYEDKVRALKDCYKATSKKLNYHFYIPIKKGDDWQIFYFFQGEEQNLSKEKFLENLKK